MLEPVRLPRLMKEKIAAEQLGVSVDTIRRERKRGRIAYTMISGRVRYTDEHLLQYIRRQERGPCINETTIDQEKSADTGSAIAPIPRLGTGRGSTPLPDRRAAYLSAQATLSRRN